MGVGDLADVDPVSEGSREVGGGLGAGEDGVEDGDGGVKRVGGGNLVLDGLGREGNEKEWGRSDG